MIIIIINGLHLHWRRPGHFDQDPDNEISEGFNPCMYVWMYVCMYVVQQYECIHVRAKYMFACMVPN